MTLQKVDNLFISLLSDFPTDTNSFSVDAFSSDEIYLDNSALVYEFEPLVDLDGGAEAQDKDLNATGEGKSPC